MIVTYSNRTYRITYQSIALVENALGNPNLIQISLTTDCEVKVAPMPEYDIAYLPNGEYRSWQLTGINTKLNRKEQHFIYARLERESKGALLVFSVNDYNVDGTIGEGTTPSEYYYYIKLGKITATDAVEGATVMREVTLDYGYLATPADMDNSNTDWSKLFELTVDGFIRPLKRFTSYIVQGTLNIIGRFTLNDKEVNNIAREADQEEFVASDESLPTTKFLTGKFIEELKKMFLRKDQPDLTKFLIKFLDGLEAGEYKEGGLEATKLHNNGLGEIGKLQVNGDSEFRGNLSSRQFISGFPNGIGWALRMLKFLNAAGVEQEKAVGEVDDWIVRGKLRVFEFIISQLRGENDNVIFSGAMKVDHYDAETGRIYLDTEMGVTYNPFRFGDILMMQRFGGMPSEDNDYNVIKQYELRVEQAQIGDLSDGEQRLDWITFTNFVGDTSDIEEGDVLVRVDSVTDSTRKGIVKITTIDEFGAPYIDVVYGMKTDPANATKVRMGNLSGIRTKNGIDLIGLWGLYANGAYFENSTYILADGNTIEQKFSIMNGEFNSAIGQIKNNMSLEAGNILTNSTFSENTNYWESNGNSIQLFAVNGQFIVADGNFLSEKKSSADICQDSGRNVLRLKNASVLQYNSIMNIPVHEDTETEEYTYSFRLYYKAITSGTLSAGIQGSNLYIEESLQPTEEYMVMSHVGKWNEEGNFIIKYTGEIYIYGVSLYNDALADAEIRLQTQITQNAEAIKLTATKEYVDSETEAIYVKYDAELKVTAEQISQRVTKSEFNAETEALERLLEGKITVQADRIDAAVIDIDKINNTIETAGWITTAQGNTLYAAKSLENGNTIVSYINQTATTVTINASKVNLKGAVTFTMFDSSLQNRLNNVESDASDALSSATQAYSKAVSATTSANNAQNDADQAIRDAAKAINDAATAISKAGSAQAAVNNLPEWSKEASIIKALESATVIVNGYIKTSMIDVDNLFCTSLAAVRGTIGGFTISETQMTAGTSTYSGIMRLSKDVLGFESTNVISRIGKYAISVTTGIICPLYLKNTSNSGGTSSNGACMILHVGRSAYSNTPQVWINCLHDTGSGSEFRVESRYLGDSSQKERTVINVGDFMSGNQLKSFQSSAQTFRRVLYNLETGYLCYDNNA